MGGAHTLFDADAKLGDANSWYVSAVHNSNYQSFPFPKRFSSYQQPPPPPRSSHPATDYWGTHLMSSPPNPYIQYGPAHPLFNNIHDVRKKLNSWANKAETAAANIWTNLKAGESVAGSAWGKMNLMAKALTEGGFESLYKHNFTTYPNEKLNRTFACYFSTSTGPVAGTLYLSDVHVAFCSDRPVSSILPNGMEAWMFYKVIIPLEKVATVNPVTVSRKKQIDKYILLSTIDEHDFWFMGFVNHDKASKHLLDVVGVSTGSKSIPLTP